MSRLLSPRDWFFALGATVKFDGPYGDRLQGEIVRVSSNPDYLHVEVRGCRYEVSIKQDHAEMVWDQEN